MDCHGELVSGAAGRQAAGAAAALEASARAADLCDGTGREPPSHRPQGTGTDEGQCERRRGARRVRRPTGTEATFPGDAATAVVCCSGTAGRTGHHHHCAGSDDGRHFFGSCCQEDVAVPPSDDTAVDYILVWAAPRSPKVGS